MIYRKPTPIDQTVQTIQALVDRSVSSPDVRMLVKSMLDSISAATAYLWLDGSLEHADRDRLTAEALQFYADGGQDGGERARWVFSVIDGDWRRSTSPEAPS